MRKGKLKKERGNYSKIEKRKERGKKIFLSVLGCRGKEKGEKGKENY